MQDVNQKTNIRQDFPGRELKTYDTAQILNWHVILRIVVSFFIGSTAIYFPFSDNLSIFYALVGANVLVTLLSAVFIARWYDNAYFIYFQVAWDILFVTALIFVSGGVDSLFSFIYILSVINTAILLGKRGTVVCTLIYLFGFVLILSGQHAGMLHPLMLDESLEPSRISLPDLISKIVLNGAAMIIAAWLASKITEQAKQINQKLRQKQTDIEELKALNEHMIQSVAMGLLSLNPDGLITFVNQPAENILGKPAFNYIGKRLNDIFPELELDERESVLPTGITYRTEKRESHLSISSSVLTNDRGQNIGWIVSFQDVTDIRLMEEEIQRNDKLAAVGKMAAGIAHEIRNPLASVSGSIQLLQNELDLDPVNQSLMSIVLRETDRLNALITDFLIFARPGRLEPELVDITSLLNQTLGMLRNDPSCKDGVVIEQNIEQKLFANADSHQLSQLFWNLFKNAIQAMPKGGTILVSAKASNTGELENESGALIEVSDDGEGMDDQILQNMYDPFFTTKEMGTGLGLTTAFRIVENHKGRIWCDTKKGEGTTFRVLIPSV